MKYACILLMLSGCWWGRTERVKLLEENPIINDSTFAAVKVDAPVRHVLPRQFRAATHDTTQVTHWPDDQVFRFVLFYRNLDTQGNPIPEPEVRFQYELFNADTALGYRDMRDRIDHSESDYWISGDTLYLNVPFLAQFIPASDEYFYKLRFRLRLEDFFRPSKNSGWIYARKVLNLYRADRVDGVPQKPILLEVH